MSLRQNFRKSRSNSFTHSERMRLDSETNPAEQTKLTLAQLRERAYAPNSSYNDQLSYFLANTEANRSLAQGRTIHPQLGALSEKEISTLRLIEQAYDRPVDVGKLDTQTVRALQGFGFVRVEKDGRIVPNYIVREHKGVHFGAYIDQNALVKGEKSALVKEE